MKRFEQITRNTSKNEFSIDLGTQQPGSHNIQLYSIDSNEYRSSIVNHNYIVYPSIIQTCNHFKRRSHFSYFTQIFISLRIPLHCVVRKRI